MVEKKDSSSSDNNNDTKIPKRNPVELKKLGPLIPDATSMADWPNGDFLLESLLKSYGGEIPSKDPRVWQAMARRALLTKFGRLEASLTECTSIEDEMSSINETWKKMVAARSGATNTDRGDDLMEFLQTGGLSNKRPLQWAFMDIAAGCQFRLHAHPNVELVYCVQGELHEIRMDGEALTKSFDPLSDAQGKVQGPSLLDCHRTWKFGSLTSGNWLVNEVGSIHKSFTATNGKGCVLLCLWGGSHADIPQEPSLVTDALDSMDRRLTETCGCHPSKEELVAIQETFLPESERSSKASRC